MAGPVTLTLRRDPRFSGAPLPPPPRRSPPPRPRRPRGAPGGACPLFFPETADLGRTARGPPEWGREDIEMKAVTILKYRSSVQSDTVDRTVKCFPERCYFSQLLALLAERQL